MNIKVFCVFQYGGLLSDLLEWNSVDFCHGLSLCRGCCLVFIFKAVAKQTVTCGSGIIVQLRLLHGLKMDRVRKGVVRLG